MNVYRLQHLILSAALLLAPPAALAAQYDGYAQVRRVTPRYEQVNIPRQECRSEYIQPSPAGRGDSYVGSVIGGITGAIVGNQVGRGHGNVAATALGAITGAIVGDRLQNRAGGDWGGREIRRCRTRDQWERRLVGYRVVYEYAGHRYTALLPNDPGDTLRVRVSVEPY
jgi:uncharacterized protein YcfJ